jgi:hypothetical protein
MSTNHCLRPRFTENILTYLLDGTSVNVVSEVTEETDRFVTDIKGCDLQNTRLLDVNMRVCRGDYKQFLLHLWQQFHQKPLNECPDLFDILSDLEQAEQQFIIVLNHLDVMGNADVDAQFNQSFYQRLNSLKNYHHVTLLIMTNVHYHQIMFNIGGEFKGSKLDIQQVENLPALTMDETRFELNRRHLNLSDVHLSHIMQQADYDYVLLDYLSRQLKNSSESWEDMSSFIQQLKNWHKEYKQQAKSPIDYKVNKGVNTATKFVVILNGFIKKLRELYKSIKNFKD